MNQKQAKRLRKEAIETWMNPLNQNWQSYQGLKAANGKQQIILVECGKAIYRELKKEYYKEKSVSQ